MRGLRLLPGVGFNAFSDSNNYSELINPRSSGKPAESSHVDIARENHVPDLIEAARILRGAAPAEADGAKAFEWANHAFIR